MYYLNRLRTSAIVPLRGALDRHFSVSNNSKNEDDNTETERKISSILKNRFTDAKTIQVNDISGGCGHMFAITVISPEFKDISMVKQHKMVTEALKKEIKEMHGLRIVTDHNIDEN